MALNLLYSTAKSIPEKEPWPIMTIYLNQTYCNFVFFQDLPSVIEKTADFLGVKINAEDKASLLHHLSFESMRVNKSVNFEDDIRKIEQEKGEDGLSFMRLGQAGAWKKVLSPELAKLYDEWTEKNLKDTDFPVPPWKYRTKGLTLHTVFIRVYKLYF